MLRGVVVPPGSFGAAAAAVTLHTAGLHAVTALARHRISVLLSGDVFEDRFWNGNELLRHAAREYIGASGQ